MCVVKRIQPCIERIKDYVDDKVNKPSSAGDSHNINKKRRASKICSNREHREDQQNAQFKDMVDIERGFKRVKIVTQKFACKWNDAVALQLMEHLSLQLALVHHKYRELL